MVSIAAEENDHKNGGRIIFYGNIKKLRGGIRGKMHPRWVVMRGWQLYWYRKAGDSTQKGILTLPSHEIIVNKDQENTSFTLPKEEAKDGNMASRAMTFGDDFNTRIFRIFVDFMIRYKIYCEYTQKNGLILEPMVERYLKVD